MESARRVDSQCKIGRKQETLHNAGLMLGQRRRRWFNITPTVWARILVHVTIYRRQSEPRIYRNLYENTGPVCEV